MQPRDTILNVSHFYSHAAVQFFFTQLFQNFSSLTIFKKSQQLTKNLQSFFSTKNETNDENCLEMRRKIMYNLKSISAIGISCYEMIITG